MHSSSELIPAHKTALSLARGKLPRALGTVGFKKFSERMQNARVYREFLRLREIEGPKRAEQVDMIRIALRPSYKNEVNGVKAEVKDLYVNYPSKHFDEVFSPYERAVLIQGYQGKDLYKTLSNDTWPNWVYAFRPNLGGQAILTLPGEEDLVLGVRFHSVSPQHIWSMLRDPSLDYSGGIGGSDASFGPIGGETRFFAWKYCQRSKDPRANFEGMTVPQANEFGATEEFIEVVGKVFEPIQERIKVYGKQLLI